jgi:hypothetical protein
LEALVVKNAGRMTRSGAHISLVLMIALATGCSSSIYGWQVRTGSAEFAPSFDPARLTQEPAAVFGALTMPGLRGNEVGLDFMLAQVLHRVAPQIQIVSPQRSMSKINELGLASEYTQMRADAEQSHILNRETLKKLGTAIGVRYVFQPRLAAFTQTMYDRWTFPGLGVLLMQVRTSNLRMSLQLWNTETGELLWASMAEGTMQSEAVSKDPVYFEDAARVALGSIVSDFLNRQTASTYTPLDKLLDQLIQVPSPEETARSTNTNPPRSQ